MTSLLRIVRRVLLVCVAMAVLLGTSLSGHAEARTVRAPHEAQEMKVSFAGQARGVYSSRPVKVSARGREMLAFPPSKTASAHAMSVVYLHGARGRAENGCPWFRSGASELGWLVCPDSKLEMQPNGSSSWGADVFAQGPIVADALSAARAQGASSEPGVAVGFSQGSYVALDLVKARLATFRGLVLLGAELHPNVKTLRDRGVKRVALGAGIYDAPHDSLVEEAARMSSEGLEARFFDLGHVGHTYAVEDATVLRDAIVWAGGAEG